jgi:ParB family chromosome partitioning protein
MAKLTVSGKAGFNAGETFSKLVRISDIKIDPEISKVFTRSDTIRDEIKAQIKKFGFDKGQPITIWKGKNTLLDGHTRLEAARESGLEKIPAVELEFETFDDAILYTFERQAIRRNLTAADIFKAAQLIPKGPKGANGTGRKAEVLAKRLGVSAATIYQAQKIAKEATKEDIKAIQKGETSLKAVYKKLTKHEGEENLDGDPKQTSFEYIAYALDQLQLLGDYLKATKTTESNIDSVDSFFNPVPEGILKAACAYLKKAQTCLKESL